MMTTSGSSNTIVVFLPLGGGKVCTNGVPFVRMVQADAAARSDKTWRRFANWHLYFHRDAAEEVEVREVAREWLAGLVGDWAPLDDAPQRIQVVLYKVGGEVIAVDYGYDVAVHATFAVVVDGRVVFSAFYEEADVPYPHWGYKFESMKGSGEGGWEIIAHLSGQARSRAARVAVAARHGQMAGAMVGHAVQKAHHRVQPEIIALAGEDFEPAQRGGYIVRSRGKYIITRENTPGFYRVTRETERVRFARLVEPYSSVPCPAGIEEHDPDMLAMSPFAARLAREYAPDDLALGCDELRSRAGAAATALEQALASDDAAALAKAAGEAAYWQGLACGCPAMPDVAWAKVAHALSAHFGARITPRKALRAAMHAAWNILASRQFDGADAAEWALDELQRQLSPSSS